jgi:hypothetical protein
LSASPDNAASVLPCIVAPSPPLATGDAVAVRQKRMPCGSCRPLMDPDSHCREVEDFEVLPERGHEQALAVRSTSR